MNRLRRWINSVVCLAFLVGLMPPVAVSSVTNPTSVPIVAGESSATAGTQPLRFEFSADGSDAPQTRQRVEADPSLPDDITAYNGVERWRYTSPLTDTRVRHGMAVVNNDVFVVGGDNGAGTVYNSVMHAPITTSGALDAWTPVASMLVPRTRAGVVVSGTNLYAIGGHDGITLLLSVEWTTVQADGALGSWVSTSALNVARAGAAAVVAGDYVYVLGGQTAEGSIVDSIERARINPNGSLGAWAILPSPLRIPRCDGAAVFAPGIGYIYLIGGASPMTRLNSVDKATVNPDGSLGAWASTTGLLYARQELAAAFYMGYLFALGGQSMDARATSSVEFAPIFLDGTGDVGDWYPTASLNMERAGLAAVTSGDQVYAAGGYSERGASSAAERSIIRGNIVIPAPRMERVTPPGGPNHIKTTITLEGHAFIDRPQIQIGPTLLRQVGYLNATRLTATVPSGIAPGVYDVTVINPDGQFATLEQGYTVQPGSGAPGQPPTLNLLSPTSSDNLQDIQLALTGTQFVSTTVVALGNTLLRAVAYVSSTRLLATVPQGTPPGVYDVRVINPDGQMAQLSGALTLSAGNGIWRLKSGRMTPRCCGASGVLDDLLYAVAGGDAGGFGRLNEAYDPATGQWDQRMDHPGIGGRAMPGAAVLSGTLYTFGGLDLTHDAATSWVYAYNSASGIWQSQPNYPLLVYGLAAAVRGGQVYLFGGERPVPGTGSSTQYPNVYVFDPFTGVYTARADLPVAASRAVALEYGGKVYVIGGLRAGSAFSGTQDYDPATDQGTSAAPLPQPRAEATGLMLYDKLYVIGGHDGRQVQRTVYEYDPAANVWQERPPLNMPRVGAFGGVMGGKLYVAGGRSSLNAAMGLDSIEEGDLGIAPPSPRLYVSDSAHDFGAVETAWQFNIANLGSGTLNWSIAENPSAAWLDVSPISGNGSSVVRVTVARDGLPAGQYAADLVITSNGGQATLHVVMSVTAVPRLQVSPQALVFNIGQDAKAALLSNLGGGELNWSISSDANWAQASPLTGTGNATITVTVDRTNLPTGQSNTLLHLTSNGGNADVSITIFKDTPPVLAVDPLTLDFGTQTGMLPFQVLNVGGGLLSWQASANQPWIALSNASGQNGGTVQVSINREGRASGYYTGTITVAGNGQQQNVNVYMQVPTPPRLGVSTNLVDLGSTANTGSFEVRNMGGGMLQWVITESTDWLTLSLNQGQNSQTVVVTVNRIGQSPGQKTATLQISSAFGAATVEVRMTVEAGPLLQVAPTSINLGSQSVSGEFQIHNGGGGTLTWSISQIPSWLSLSRTSGTGDAMIQVTALRNQMAPGSYTAQLRVQGDGQAGQQIVTVTAVQEAAPQLDASPTRLDFGDSLTALNITIRNSGGGTLNWQVSDDRSWITLSRSSGTNNGTVEVRVDRTGLAAGQYSGRVTVQGANQTRTVDIVMSVLPPSITHLTVGNVTVYADNFEWQGGRKYKATGNVRFNQRGRLTGSSDYCLVDQDASTLRGLGTVALETTQGLVEIFTDLFSISPNDGKVLPLFSSFQFRISNLASFETFKGAMEISVDVVNQRVNGKTKIKIVMPDNNFQETLTWQLDYQNQLTGSIADLSLQVDGLTLRAKRITADKTGLRVGEAYLEFPTSLGGSASTTLRSLVIKGQSPYIELGGVAFEVNNINFGGPTGFEIQRARLELSLVSGKFKLAGVGKFVFKNFYQYGQCALDVSFEIYSLDQWSGAFEIHCQNGVPIGSTGFFVTGIHGGISFGPNNFKISLGVTIVGGPYVPSPIGAYIVSGRPTLFLKTGSQGLDLGLTGDVSILKWNVAHVDLVFRHQTNWNGVHGQITINLTVVRGQATVDIWQDSTGAHFRGDGQAELLIPRGFILNTGLLVIPPSDWRLLSQQVSVGEFTKQGAKVYGIKGQITILGYSASVFVDARGNLGSGNGITFAQLLARKQFAVTRLQQASIEQTNVTISTTASALFALGWDSGSPRMRLIDPAGRVFSETLSASDVQVMTSVTQTLLSVQNPHTGTWQIEIYNLSGGESYEVGVLQSNALPQATVLAPSALTEDGSDGYLIQWQAADLDNPNAVVDLYYGASSEGPWRPITTGLPISQTSYLWDTSSAPTGEHLICVEVRDGVNIPQDVYSVGTVGVNNRSAPPVPIITGLTPGSDKRSYHVQWSSVNAPDLAGYRVYYGYSSKVYEGSIDVGDSTSAELLALQQDRQFYVAVTAYDTSGNESVFSAESEGYLGLFRIFLPLILSGY